MDLAHQELKQTIQDLLVDIHYMTDRLYEGQTQEGLNCLHEIIEKIAATADGYTATIGDAEKIIKLNLGLSQVNKAIENTDFILVSDVFKYEILAILEEILIDLKSIIIN